MMVEKNSKLMKTRKIQFKFKYFELFSKENSQKPKSENCRIFL